MLGLWTSWNIKSISRKNWVFPLQRLPNPKNNDFTKYFIIGAQATRIDGFAKFFLTETSSLKDRWFHVQILAITMLLLFFLQFLICQTFFCVSLGIKNQRSFVDFVSSRISQQSPSFVESSFFYFTKFSLFFTGFGFAVCVLTCSLQTYSWTQLKAQLTWPQNQNFFLVITKNVNSSL